VGNWGASFPKSSGQLAPLSPYQIEAYLIYILIINMLSVKVVKAIKEEELNQLSNLPKSQ
jgi:hypothetical protein